MVVYISVFENRPQPEKNVIKNETADINKLEPQENNEGGISVSVAPQNISAGASIWDFQISLSTHSVDLSEDLAQASSLFDDKSNEYKPVQWEGSPLGGHHREGILKFSPIVPIPRSIKLEIRGIGSITKRIFEWKLR